MNFNKILSKILSGKKVRLRTVAPRLLIVSTVQSNLTREHHKTYSHGIETTSLQDNCSIVSFSLISASVKCLIGSFWCGLGNGVKTHV